MNRLNIRARILTSLASRFDRYMGVADSILPSYFRRRPEMVRPRADGVLRYNDARRRQRRRRGGSWGLKVHLLERWNAGRAGGEGLRPRALAGDWSKNVELGPGEPRLN